MLLTLSHIGDFLAKAFRFLYWRVCCFMCTRRPRPMRRAATMRRGRSVRATSSRNSGGNRGRRSAIRRSARVSQRSADSAMSDSFVSNVSDPVIRRVHSDEDIRAIPMASSPSLTRLSGSHLRPFMQAPTRNSQRSSRSAEPMFPNSRNLPVLFNKYAEDVMMTTENEFRRSARLGRPKPIPAFQVVDDFWSEEEEYEEEPEKRPVPIWLCVFLVIAYIISGAFLFSGWEGWQFLDAAYFCFITLTTIGFGDFVPAQRKNETIKADEVPEVSIALCSLYLLFGISLLAMSFNLVQEEVIHSVKQVAARLGIISEDE
ncbi:unnamed protein product [Allacma fusca]|uniref:Potassium channel domain-containing protein n=1 Tax=Allacma fusca TaxID=39272 RepID=A0A8J2P5I9_9HEXA|nr:unnamed protein product [Allacma fusca]